MQFWILFAMLAYGLWEEVAAPTFQRLEDGKVTFSTTTVAAVIRYTFEDKEPDKSAGAYLAPVGIPYGRTVRARAFSSDGSEQSATLLVEAQAMPATLVEVTQNRDWKNYD